MLDQLAGKPSPSWRRSQVGLVLLFWISRILLSPAKGPRVLYLRRLNRLLARFTPWQIILSTLTILYAVRHGDVLLGLQAPEPLARLYSRDYYRATWFVTALDAGFATAMNIRWKWLRDIASLLFSAYYLLFANEADEKLRKFRAFCTVEMLRVTWEKTSNPYIRFFTRKDRPPVTVRRKLFLPRPQGSRYTKPLTVYLYYHGPSLSTAHELVMDIPGGGFICMNPEHHEERLLRWARKTGKVVVSFDYGKAPEYPFPYAIDEMYDAYSLLHATKGRFIGMNTSGEKELRVVLTGDSAGANIATGVVLRILENRQSASTSSRPPSSSAPTTPIPPLPVALVFAYAALSFHFTSWMSSSDLRVLRSDSHPDIASLLRQKDHLDHRSPLAVVEDLEKRSSGSERGRPKVLRRRRTTSWGRGLVRGLPGSASFAAIREGYFTSSKKAASSDQIDQAARDEEEEVPVTDETEKSLNERVVWWDDQAFGGGEQVQRALGEKVREEEKGVGLREKGKEVAVGEGEEGVLSETRLAMTSRTAFFNDRIISPSMCRAMALLYIGPRNAPDLHSDYHISPIFTPPALLAQFPPVYLSCGERDPFVDDTVLFAGKLREAKESRKLELLSRESRFGAGLRMSSSTTARDPILDQDEDDWVQTSIIAGWSHGYLQMVSLLPAAEKVINMHADWIVEAFERAGEAEVTPIPGVAQPSLRRLLSPIAASPLDAATPKGRAGTPAQPINVVPPTPVVPQVELDEAVGSPSPPSVTAAPDAEGLKTPAQQTSEGEEDVLTFTPRRRRGSSNASRTGSPSPAAVLSKVSPPSPTSPTFTRRTSSQSGSHDAHIVTPVERALREDLHASPLVKHNPPASLSTPTTGATPRSTTPGGARLSSAGRPSSFTAPIQSPAPVRSASRTLSPPPAPSPVVKGTRSNSSGSLPAPQGTVFIDAKELLRRRKEDVVFGISSSNGGTPKNVSRDGSRKGSDNEGEGEGKGEKVERRKTVD